jgi:hypothetical protein
MTAKILRLTVGATAAWPNRDGLFFESMPFMAMCPTCEGIRSQLGYSAFAPGASASDRGADPRWETLC